MNCDNKELQTLLVFLRNCNSFFYIKDINLD